MPAIFYDTMNHSSKYFLGLILMSFLLIGLLIAHSIAINRIAGRQRTADAQFRQAMDGMLTAVYGAEPGDAAQTARLWGQAEGLLEFTSYCAVERFSQLCMLVLLDAARAEPQLDDGELDAILYYFQHLASAEDAPQLGRDLWAALHP